ncbi:phosphatase PAP2 family protein [Myceligenerans pegani]|uniref:Phosphatase PAP2 family protein n=1 Tax=Myceligenerans pegani TaxID=2776917 RepID=A0ABR9N3V5_9MICO|nr:phosphatase PAP2 family protein [Myceligenerans sp. TRM 65318]MBE1877687.1 phosphatase PAP2 family protein [Myceligenerans sp. TRM 65318]MBE3019958.1 phosphatase PAP2 family protein [Myceligenerans sp. TRM 65318]
MKRVESGMAWLGGVSAVLLAVGTWQVVVSGPFVAADWDYHVWADANLPGGVTKWLLDAFATVTGERLVTVPVLGVLAGWQALRRRDWRPLVAVAAGLVIIAVVGYSLKFGLGRTMPWTGVDVLHGGGRAWPSGHAANAAYTWAMAGVLLIGERGLRPRRAWLAPWMLVSGLVVAVSGWIMVRVDYHWISDVPGGWALGLLALAVSVAILHRDPPIPMQATWALRLRDRLFAPSRR